MFEIDRNPVAGDGLHLSDAPIGAQWQANAHSWKKIAGHGGWIDIINASATSLWSTDLAPMRGATGLAYDSGVPEWAKA
jgi:hypothetical protein